MPGTANEETDGEKGIKCVSIGSGPAGRWLVVLEYENNFDVESTHDARDDALKRAKELAAEHKVRLVERPEDHASVSNTNDRSTSRPRCACLARAGRGNR